MHTAAATAARFQPRRITVPLFLGLLAAATQSLLSSPDVAHRFAAFAAAH